MVLAEISWFLKEVFYSTLNAERIRYKKYILKSAQVLICFKFGTLQSESNKKNLQLHTCGRKTITDVCLHSVLISTRELKRHSS